MQFHRSRSAVASRSWIVVALRTLAGVAVAALTVQPGGVEAGWRVGAAVEVITPPQPMPMAGYASRGARHAEGTLTELYAKALALEDGRGERAVLVTLDLVGIERELSRAICARLESRHGLKRRQILLSASHTHTGPVVAKNLRPMHFELFDAADRQLVNDYAALLEERVDMAVGRALEALAPAEVVWGSGTAGFAVNRRNNPEAEVHQRRSAGTLAGPSDHAVPVLAVRRDGRLVAAAFGYACHCTVLGTMEWSGDYAGFAMQTVEAAHPGATALFWAGCGGDQNPLPRRTVELARQYGDELAASVNAVLAGELRPVADRLQTSYREIPLAFGELPTREALVQQSESKNLYEASRARQLLARLAAGEPLPATYPYPLTLWRLGDEVRWHALGGEVVVDYALRLKAETGDAALGNRNVWVAAYSQDVMAYIPSRRVLLEGGYEGVGAMVYYGQPTAWSEQVEEQIVEAAHEQAREP